MTVEQLIKRLGEYPKDMQVEATFYGEREGGTLASRPSPVMSVGQGTRYLLGETEGVVRLETEKP